MKKGSKEVERYIETMDASPRTGSRDGRMLDRRELVVL